MNTCKRLFLLCLPLACCLSTVAQKQIQYGSNHGKYVSIFYREIYYEEYGKGTPLLLLQGGMKSIKDFSACIPYLAKQYRVIAPDDPGQGRSAMLDTMTYELLAEFVSKLIDILQLDSAYVLGWSDGGVAALLLAAKRPDKIKKVIASGANYMQAGLTSTDTLELIPPDYQPPPEDKKWIDEFFVANPASWRKIINDRKIMWDQPLYFPKEVFNKINIPVMIVSGDRDIIKPAHSIDMYRLLKKGQLCILPNCSHDVFADNPTLISEIAISFFGK